MGHADAILSGTTGAPAAAESGLPAGGGGLEPSAGAAVIRVHGVLHDSRVNGPGRRAVVHLQGCTLGCRGCFNPETHDPLGGRAVAVDALAAQLVERAPEGVTISGGEPFQQPEALTALVRAVRARGIDSVVVFTGYALAELPEGAGEGVDVLIAGRYVATDATPGRITASGNQRLEFLTDRHTPKDFGEGGRVEFSILPDGRVVMTGFPDPGLARAVKRMG